MSPVVNAKEKKRIVGRIGSKPISIITGVEVDISIDNYVTVKGKLGTLHQAFDPETLIQSDGETIKILRPSDQPRHRALQGLTRALLYNMVVGVSEGYQRFLELVGMGYRVQQDGVNLVFNVGYSHTVQVAPPEGITLTVESPTRVAVFGCSKQQVGQIAAEIRSIRKPDAYKGKGVRYVGEVVRLKPGKAAARK